MSPGEASYPSPVADPQDQNIFINDTGVVIPTEMRAVCPAKILPKIDFTAIAK